MILQLSYGSYDFDTMCHSVTYLLCKRPGAERPSKFHVALADQHDAKLCDGLKAPQPICRFSRSYCTVGSMDDMLILTYPEIVRFLLCLPLLEHHARNLAHTAQSCGHTAHHMASYRLTCLCNWLNRNVSIPSRTISNAQAVRIQRAHLSTTQHWVLSQQGIG
jgi:hypothetical protein